jgi:mRNA interferase RelE/StbE
LALRIEWHPAAIDDVAALATGEQRRIRKALADLATLDDPRQRLIPYAGNLKGFHKLRVGDFRLVCEIRRRDSEAVLIIHVAHRSVVYGRRGRRAIERRGE